VNIGGKINMFILQNRSYFDFFEEIKILDFVITNVDYVVHSHEFMEIAYITEGTGKHIHGDCESFVKKGDYVILNFRNKHSFSVSEGQNLHVTNCIFKPEFIDHSLSECKGFNDILGNYLLPSVQRILTDINSGFIFNDNTGKILELLEKIKVENTEKELGYTHVSRVYLIELIILTIRSINTSLKEISYYSDDIKIIKDYIDNDFVQKINLTELAQLVNISPSALSRKYKKITGIGINEYIQHKRIELACRVLANTSKKISEVAELCGYSDVKYFVDLFKRIINLPPSKYRNKNQNNHIS
jgi:AraC family L-rhamnose operon transcriptional activator RhaR